MTQSNIQFVGLGHICIVVDDINSATKYYKKIFNATPYQDFPKFKNIGFAKAAGFLDKPEDVIVTIRFLNLPNTNIFLELMQYHNPCNPIAKIEFKKTNEVGGIRHISLKVKNIDDSFAFLKTQNDVKMINASSNYMPYKIDAINQDEFYFYDSELENNKNKKLEVCGVIGSIKYFYFLDKYGIQWELEQGHDEIGE